MSTLFEYCNTGFQNGGYGTGYGTDQECQSFTPSTYHTITSVKLLVKRGDTDDIGNLKVEIKAADVNHKPTGAALCSGTADNTSWANWGWIEITLGAGANLNAGTEYCIVCSYEDSGDSAWSATAAGSNVYAGGVLSYSSNSGSTWTQTAGSDYLFEEWGDEIVAPTVTTQAVGDIQSTTATGNGNVTDDGGSAITERGVCYCLAEEGDPDTTDDKDTSTGTTGAFTTSITGLSSSTDYHARAYAINAIDTSYGETVDFTTLDVDQEWVEILTEDRALALDNTTEFTPTDDYHPATKKYVDDNIGTGGFTGFDGEEVTDDNNTVIGFDLGGI
jgi:hypothetical protein